MKEGWKIKRLEELCQIELGKTPYRANKSFWDTEKKTDNVWLSIADLLKTDGDVVCDSKEYITDKAAKLSKIVKNGTLLLSFKLTLGRLAFAGRDLYTNEAIAALSIKDEKVIDKYFLYQFLSLYDWDAATEGDVKVKGKTLNKAKLKEIEVHFPKSLPEQKRIVSILDEAFAAIAKAKANAEQNLKNAKELFESVIQLTMDNGKLKIEDGWEEKRLGDVLVKTETTDPKKNPDTEFTYLDVSSVNKETKEIETPTILLGKDAPSRAKKFIRTGDVIFATVRPTHSRVALIPEEFDEQVCSTGYFVFRTKEIVSNKLVFYFLLTKGFNEQMEKLQKGASYPAVTDNDVKGILFRFPKSKEEQQTIVRQLDSLRAETQKLEAIYQQKLLNLEELKKSILQKAFAGELTSTNLVCNGKGE